MKEANNTSSNKYIFNLFRCVSDVSYDGSKACSSNHETFENWHSANHYPWSCDVNKRERDQFQLKSQRANSGSLKCLGGRTFPSLRNYFSTFSRLRQRKPFRARPSPVSYLTLWRYCRMATSKWYSVCLFVPFNHGKHDYTLQFPRCWTVGWRQNR